MIDDMENEYTSPSVNKIFDQLNQKANAVYNFVMLYSGYMSERHNYGVGIPINMVEVHTLTAIEENPGITISQLASLWQRTNSALSQTATKLEKKGYVIRRKDRITPGMFISTPQRRARSSVWRTSPTTC